MIEKLEKAEARFDKLEESLADPEIYKDQESYAALMKERKALTPVIEKYRAYKAAVAAREPSCGTTPRRTASCASWRRRNLPTRRKSARRCTRS